MVELENMLVPKLKQHIKNWRRYVDYTEKWFYRICFISARII